jgi:hypothetical protein
VLFDTPNDLGHLDPERAGDRFDGRPAWIRQAAFDFRQVPDRDSGPMGERFLSQVLLGSQLADGLRERRLSIA